MKLTSQFMRKFYHLLAVVLLIMGTLLPTVVTYAQEASAEETATPLSWHLSALKKSSRRR